MTDLKRLSSFLFKYYGKKAVILLDEYDTPMQEAYVKGYWRELVELTRSLFNTAFKTNPFLELQGCGKNIIFHLRRHIPEKPFLLLIEQVPFQQKIMLAVKLLDNITDLLPTNIRYTETRPESLYQWLFGLMKHFVSLLTKRKILLPALQ